MPTMDTSCLYSTVKNVCGQRRKFSFLPPHGRELDNNEEITIYGDVREAVIRHDRNSEARNIQAFERAVEDRLLEIVKTPNPLLYDETVEETQMLKLDNGSLSAVDPCWTVSVSG